MIFTQPWRAQIDMRRLSEELNELAILDIALSKELASFLRDLNNRARKVVVIDHHVSSEDHVRDLQQNGIKVIWRKAPSTPRLMTDVLKPVMNPYEIFLVDVADVCEGSETKNGEVAKAADLIKLSIARDPGDINYLVYLVDLMLRGQDITQDTEVLRRARVAKWLLHRLLKIMNNRALEVSGAKIVALDISESRIFAGILGIASTEFAKMSKRDVVLIRREEGKVVVTVRSMSDRAFKICKELASKLSGRYGGHAEAASATLPDISLDESVNAVKEVLKSVPKPRRTRRYF